MFEDMFQQLKQAWMSVWDQERKALVFSALDTGQVDKTTDYQEIEYGKHYVRLWLSQMYLTAKTKFFINYYPVVHSLIKFPFEEKAVQFPNVADATKVGTQKLSNGDFVARNYVLTPMIPFNSGVIEMEAGLLAIQGTNYLETLITTLSDFASLISVPQFSAALDVAGPLAKGLQGLLSQGGLHLALHDSFGPKKQGGYFAAIRATPAEVDAKQLRVIHDELHKVNSYDASMSAPLEGYDYMLFRIEVLTERPQSEWENLTSIQEPMKSARAALSDSQDDKADSYLRKAILAAHEAPELTQADRNRVKRQLREDFDQFKKDLFSGLVAGEEFNLGNSMKRAISVDQALSQGDPSFLELFSS